MNKFVFILIIKPLKILIIFAIFALPIQYLFGKIQSKFHYQNLPNPKSSRFKLEQLRKEIPTPNPKFILFWTKMYNEERLSDYCINKNTLQKCPYKCNYSTNKAHLHLSNAIVFHSARFYFGDLPNQRDDQIWVFFTIESPLHTQFNWEGRESIFNWTMTYRRDSDIPIPYGEVIPLRNNEERETVSNFEAFRLKKFATIAISNCVADEESNRKDLLGKLMRLLPGKIDIYGKCGDLDCPGTVEDHCSGPMTCHRFLSGRYKFFLSFENSLCEEYVTEKFYNALLLGMLPIVFGLENYTRIAPPNSYIDTRSFPNVKALANHLLLLEKNYTAYSEYFQWKRDFKIDQSDYFDRIWCSLCEKLWKTPKETRNTYKNITRWWNYNAGGNHRCIYNYTIPVN